MSHWTRRRFLRNTIGIAAGIAAVSGGGYYLSRDRIHLGLIGAGIRGQELARVIRLCSWYYWRYGVITAVCDVDRPRAESVRDAWCPGAVLLTDYRELLQRSEIEGVIIATPYHWHVPIAKAALNAGKVVYLEKPVSLTISEGRELVDLEAKVSLPVLVGTQQRNETRFRTACELIRLNRLGTVQRVEVTVPQKQPEPVSKELEIVPPGLDWDRWLGPAPSAPFSTARHKTWRSWWDYGGGEIANMGAHHLDIAHWALGLEQTGPVKIEGKQQSPPASDAPRVPAQFEVTLTYANGLVIQIKADPLLGTGGGGLTFVGDKSTLLVDRLRLEGPAVDDLPRNPIPPQSRLHPAETNTPRDTRQHLCHFLDCVRITNTPVSDLSSGHRTATACHLANLALRLNRPLHWDPQTEKLLNDPDASKYLTRHSRPGW